MHQRRGLQGVAGVLAGHVPVRRAVQFDIDQRRQVGESRLVPGAPGPEQPGDFVRRGRRHRGLRV